MATDREFLRHTLATLAYRASKPLRDAPPSFAEYRASPTTRTPGEIVAHLCDLMEWGEHMARGIYKWSNSKPSAWNTDVERFFELVGRYDATLAGDAPIDEATLRKCFQGSVADSTQHVGQLTMLRRLEGAPIRGENYAKADIATGQTGMKQPPPNVEFE